MHFRRSRPQYQSGATTTIVRREGWTSSTETLLGRPRYKNRVELWVKANPAGRSETSNDPGWAQPESRPSPVWLNKSN